MKLIHRRGFVKTLIATAVGTSPLCARSSRAAVLLGTESASAPDHLQNGDQQLQVSSGRDPLTFQNFVRVSNEWHPATLPQNPLVTGPSFPLTASTASRKNAALAYEGSGEAEGLDGKSLRYNWNAEISAFGDVAFPWFRFRTTLHLPSPVRLQQGAQVEPQLILWLSSNSTLMEGQSGSWRRVLLQQPTRNSSGAWGNDLPALYLLDQNAGIETLMFFDVGDIDWMSIENIPRFLAYRCSSISRLNRDGTQRLGVGLIANEATGNVLPAGEVRFTYWLLQRPCTQLLTEQQAVARWMQALLPLFEEKLAWPPCASISSMLPAGTIKELQRKAQTQVEVAGHTGLRAYVTETSQLWKQPTRRLRTDGGGRRPVALPTLSTSASIA